MSTPERQQDANPSKGVGYGANANPPDDVGATEIEARRQSELAGQQAAERSPDAPETADSTPDSSRRGGNRTNADQAKENERQAEEDGRELPG